MTGNLVLIPIGRVVPEGAIFLGITGCLLITGEILHAPHKPFLVLEASFSELNNISYILFKLLLLFKI